MSADAVVPVAQAEPTFACFVQSKACRGKCFQSSEMFVPPIRWLFWVIRYSGVDPKEPLTAMELSPFIRCNVHSSGSLSDVYNKENGINETFRLQDTLTLMDRWVQDNASEAIRQAERRARHQEYAARHAREKQEKLLRKQEERIAKALNRPANGTATPAPKLKNFGTYTEVVRKKKQDKPENSKKGNKNQSKGGKGR